LAVANSKAEVRAWTHLLHAGACGLDHLGRKINSNSFRYLRLQGEQMIARPATQIQRSVTSTWTSKLANEGKLPPQQPFASVELEQIARCVAIEIGPDVLAARNWDRSDVRFVRCISERKRAAVSGARSVIFSMGTTFGHSYSPSASSLHEKINPLAVGEVPVRLRQKIVKR
jgi:hypothetical protein